MAQQRLGASQDSSADRPLASAEDEGAEAELVEQLQRQAALQASIAGAGSPQAAAPAPEAAKQGVQGPATPAKPSAGLAGSSGTLLALAAVALVAVAPAAAPAAALAAAALAVKEWKSK